MSFPTAFPTAFNAEEITISIRPLGTQTAWMESITFKVRNFGMWDMNSNTTRADYLAVIETGARAMAEKMTDLIGDPDGDYEISWSFTGTASEGGMVNNEEEV